MRKISVAVMSALLLVPGLSACSKPTKAPQISIENPVLRKPMPGQTTAAAYFDIINTGAADVLLAASSPISPNVELHTHLHEDGMMKMRRVKTVPIPADATVSFKPGGLHIMLFEAELKDGGYAYPLTLTFEKSGDVTIIPEINQ